MCGIFVCRSRSLNYQAVRRSHESIAHRGPDHSGFVESEDELGQHLYLGHVRLSIIDIAERSNQPMHSNDGRFTICFNGELYNHKEVRANLEAIGIIFQTNSDTEVFLKAFIYWGVKCFDFFNGMWAAVIYDHVEEELIACRDRLGVKPLLFCVREDTTIIASEPIAFIEYYREIPKIDLLTVSKFLLSGESDGESNTFFDEVKSILPGAIYRFSKFGNLRIEKYFDVDRELNADETSKDLNCDDIGAKLTNAVSLRLDTDAKSSVLLSGGLDSSLLVKTACDISDPKLTKNLECITTYSYQSAEHQKFNEAERARQFYKSVKVNERPHDILQNSQFMNANDLWELVATQQEPFNTPSISASWYVYKKLAKKKIKVALVGEGADEVWAGYQTRYARHMFFDLLKEMKLFSALKLFLRGNISAGIIIKHLIWNLPTKALFWVLQKNNRSISAASSILHQSLIRSIRDRRMIKKQSLKKLLLSDLSKTNLPYVLRYADRNSMRHGVEVRAPYLDIDFVRLAFSVCAKKRLGNGPGKYYLRKYARTILESFNHLEKKDLGFGHAEQFDFIRALPTDLIQRYDDTVKHKLVNTKFIKKLIATNEQNPETWNIISVMVWQIWLEKITHDYT